MLTQFGAVLLHRERDEASTDRYTFCNGVVWTRKQAQASFGNDWLGGLHEFSKSLHSLSLDLTSFVYLCGLILVTGMFPINNLNLLL